MASLSLGNKVGGFLVAWPCHSPGLLAGFKTFPAASFPPPPWVANRGSLVPVPIELPCSLHTKNGNPQAILGAVPSQTVAMAPCSHWAVTTASLLPPGCWTFLLALCPAQFMIGQPQERLAAASVIWANQGAKKGTMGVFHIGSLAARWWEGLGNVAWAQGGETVSQCRIVCPITKLCVPA